MTAVAKAITPGANNYINTERPDPGPPVGGSFYGKFRGICNKT